MSETVTQRDATTWFSVLRAAKSSSDKELETMARRELEALGYRVIVLKPKVGREGQS